MGKTVELLEKLCIDCDEIKPVSEFHKAKGGKDGFYRYCRICAGRRVEQSKARFIAEHGIEAWHEKNRQATRRSRDKTGNATGKEYERHRREAVSALIRAHRKEFDHLLLLAKRGELDL